MHWHDRPGNRPAPRHSQVLPCGQLEFSGTVKEFLLYSVLKLLPPMVRERGHVIENEPAILGIELRGSLRRPRTPGRAQIVDQFAKRGIIRSFLLRPRTGKGHQCAKNS